MLTSSWNLTSGKEAADRGRVFLPLSQTLDGRGRTYANREKIEIERIIKNARPQGANGRKGIISDN